MISLILYVITPLLLLPFARGSKHWPSRKTEIGHFLRSSILAGICLLPVGLVSFAKIGGDVNSIHLWHYLAPAIVLGVMSQLSEFPRPILPGSMLALVFLVAASTRHFPFRPATGPLKFASLLAAANPGALWFPYNPVVMFFSDRRLYHVEDGIATRHLAGLGPRQATFLRHLPAQLTGVVYPAAHKHPFALQLLPELNSSAATPSWTIYTQKSPP
ncbi:MAG: hypothetical protein ABIY47_09085 [Opitutaceae bacterium]